MILAVARIEAHRALNGRRVLIVFLLFAAVAMTMGRTVGQPLESSEPNQWDIAFDLVHDTRWVIWIVIPLLAAVMSDLLIWASVDREALILTRLLSKANLVKARVLTAAVLGPAYVIIGLAGSVVAGLTFADPGLGLSSYALAPLHSSGSVSLGKTYTLPDFAAIPPLALLLMGLYVGFAAGGFVLLLCLVSCLIALRPWLPSAVIIGVVLVLWRAGNNPWNPLTHILWQSHVPNIAGTTTSWVLSAALVALAYAAAVRFGNYLVHRPPR